MPDTDLNRFAAHSPATVMAVGLLKRALAPKNLDDLCQHAAEPQYTRDLLCSTVFESMTQLAGNTQADQHGASQTPIQELAASIVLMYHRLNGVDTRVAAGLVRQSVEILGPILVEMKRMAPTLLEGYRVRKLDSAFLGGTSEPTSQDSLVDSSLAVFDPILKMVVDVISCKEGNAWNQVLPEPDYRDLWIADHNLCTPSFLTHLATHKACFLITHHPRISWKPTGLNIPRGDITEQDIILPGVDVENQAWRRISHAGINLLTNLPLSAANARHIIRLYQDPWTTYQPFREWSWRLHTEIKTLSSSSAGFFGSCMALLAGNILTVIRAALECELPPDDIGNGYSGLFLSREMGSAYNRMRIAIPPDQWEEFRLAEVPELTARLLQLSGGVDLSTHPHDPDVLAWEQMNRRLAELEKFKSIDDAQSEASRRALHMRDEDDIEIFAIDFARVLEDFYQFPLQGCAVYWMDTPIVKKRLNTPRWVTILTRKSGEERWQKTLSDTVDPIVWEVIQKNRILYRPDLNREDVYREQSHLQDQFRQPVLSVLDYTLSLGGVVRFVHENAGAFSEEDIRSAQQLVGIIPRGFVLMEAFRNGRLRAQQAQILSLEMALMSDIDELLQGIAQNAVRLVGAERGLLFLYDEEEGILKPRAQTGLDEEVFGQLCLLPGEGCPGHVFATGKPVLVPKGALPSLTLPRPWIQSLLEEAQLGEQWRSSLCIPLKAKTQISGALLVDSGRKDLTSFDLKMLENWSEYVGRLLEQTFGMQNVQESNRELKRLLAERQIAESELHAECSLRDAENLIRLKVALMEKPEDLLEGVFREVREQLSRLDVPWESCSAQIFDTKGSNFLSFAADANEGFDWLIKDDLNAIRPHVQEYPWVKEVWETGKPRYATCDWKTAEGWGERSLVDVPFCQGTLAINGPGTRIFSDRNVEILQRFARIFSLAYERFVDLVQRRRAEQALQESQERLVEFSRRLLQAQEEERRRVARDLHDGINQTLAAAKFHLAAIESPLSANREILTQVLKVENVIEGVVQEVRSICHNLSPPVLDDLGLPAAVHHLCEDFVERTRIAVENEWAYRPKHLDMDVEIALYRILQEALANIEKHSNAREVRLIFLREGEYFTMKIRDTGKGFELPLEQREPNGSGLNNIRERAQLIGGSATIRSAPGEGTELIVKLPLDLSEESSHEKL